MVKRAALSVALFAFTLGGVFSADGRQQPKQSVALPIDEVIHKFAAAESRNRTARNYFLYTQDFAMQTLEIGGFTSGECHRISEIVYDNSGTRSEKIVFYPPSTLRGLTITPQDIQDLGGVQPFALALEDLPKYQVDYVGKEHVDELETYVFDVKPKQI